MLRGCTLASKALLSGYQKSIVLWQVTVVPHVRGWSRNVEGGVLIVCRAVRSNFVVALALPMAVRKGV